MMPLTFKSFNSQSNIMHLNFPSKQRWASFNIYSNYILQYKTMIIGSYYDIIGNNAIKLGDIWHSAGRQYPFWKCEYDFHKGNHQSTSEA